MALMNTFRLSMGDRYHRAKTSTPAFAAYRNRKGFFGTRSDTVLPANTPGPLGLPLAGSFDE